MLRICLNAHIELAEMQVFSVSINRKKDIERASHEKGGKEINHYMVYFLFIYKLDKIEMVTYSILGLLADLRHVNKFRIIQISIFPLDIIINS